MGERWLLRQVGLTHLDPARRALQDEPHVGVELLGDAIDAPVDLTHLEDAQVPIRERVVIKTRRLENVMSAQKRGLTQFLRTA